MAPEGSPLYWFFVALELIRSEKELLTHVFLARPTEENYNRMAAAIMPAIAEIERAKKERLMKDLDAVARMGPAIVQQKFPAEEKIPARRKKPPERR